MKRLVDALLSILDPRNYLHAFRLIHFYGYSHVQPKRKIESGPGTLLSPNVSLRNGSNIKIGKDCHIGERVCLWAGDSHGKIIIGNNVSIAPGSFITASDYQFRKGIKFREQPKKDMDVILGDDIWIGTGVTITAGVEIGTGCIVAAGAVVTRSLPQNSIAGGVPARVIKERV
ncbi:acyltransferase [Pelagicoccus sp. SDUM812002]|uniref:acyltransferase n=1 Tax=Pelagicoccus sp. SDUM812002 TaxID=3041266 RepID=UPI00280CD001|nr:acyltransferase [Pelagicoccus sp. SDUM812002]MDQ8188063.1 acyltransferase [Pelagicoccus sp. SDUM812002]